MKEWTLWHGSPVIVEKPTYGTGKSYNDYGQGFYCTEHEELAKEWACAQARSGYANRYSISMEGLRECDLGDASYTTLHWLAVLAANRRFHPETAVAAQGLAYLQEHFAVNLDGYDIVRGYRADDSYFSFARAFVGNAISLEQLSRAMRSGDIGEQVMIKSRKAFEHLKFAGFTEAEGDVYYPKRKARDEAARRAYRQEAMRMDLDGIFMRDIIRERMGSDDERLR